MVLYVWIILMALLKFIVRIGTLMKYRIVLVR